MYVQGQNHVAWFMLIHSDSVNGRTSNIDTWNPTSREGRVMRREGGGAAPMKDKMHSMMAICTIQWHDSNAEGTLRRPACVVLARYDT